MTNDMTKGNPGKKLFYFAIPMIIGNIFQQLYNVVDSIIVGNFIGADALAAVGASTSITFLFIAIATGISIGSSVVISQLYGAGLYTKMKTAISTVLISVFVLSTILMILGLSINKLILKFMNTPSNILEDAKDYLGIYFLGLIFLFLYNALTAVFNALGDSRSPLYFLFTASVINIGLDLLFVIQFRMGVAGVAWATLIAQGTSALLSFIFLVKRIKKIKTYDVKTQTVEIQTGEMQTVAMQTVTMQTSDMQNSKIQKEQMQYSKIYEKESNDLKTEDKFEYFNGKLLIFVCKIAIPSIIQQSILSIGIVLVQTLVNGYGSVVMAGYAAATKVDSIAIMPMVNVGSALSTFTAQNIGAEKPERIKNGYRAALIIVITIGMTIAAVLFVFAESFIGCFIDASTSQNVISIGIEYLRVVSLFYFLMGLMSVTNGILRGAGDMKAFMMCTLGNLGTRVLFSYALSPIIGAKAIWWSIPTGWLIGFIISYTRYKTGGWKGKSLVTKA